MSWHFKPGGIITVLVISINVSASVYIGVG